jgi:hypothetical protein
MNERGKTVDENDGRCGMGKRCRERGYGSLDMNNYKILCDISPQIFLQNLT